MARNNTETGELKTVWLRIPPELVDKIDEIRGPEKRSRAAQIGYMLEQYIEQNYVDADEEE